MDWGLRLSLLLLLAARLIWPLDLCPPRCQCDGLINSVWCVGVQVVPALQPCTQEVWLVGTELSFIPQNSFADLVNISHIYISDDDTLTSLDRHSFYNLSRLMHVQLSGIKTLAHIHPEAFKDLPFLKYLGITNTGLTSFPGLQHIHSIQDYFILEIVENVFIKAIPANSFMGISANVLTVMLNSNGVTEIHPFAFNGSRLEEVYLNKNGDLEHIDDFAFYGVILGPTHLDVSETKVRSLPSVGMDNVERLQARGAWALKALPPLSAFLHLQSAELTFSSHCCGLKMLNRWRG